MYDDTKKEILEISVDAILPNRFQPRLTFDVEALNDLASSIKEHGIIQPLVVRKILNDKYEIIAGERRYKAATLVGMTKVPCIVMNLNDNESAEVAVIENIQRKEMTPLEEAKSFKRILDKGYLTQDDLAKRMGKSQSSIANKLRLLNLDELVQDAILNNKISERHARSLLKIENKEMQREILQEILEKRLTVKQTDELIKERYDGKSIQEPIQKIVQDDWDNMFIDIPTPSVNMNNNEMLSKPQVTIPMNNITNEVNPQMDLINNLGKVDPNKKYEKDKEDTYIEPLPDEKTNPELNIFRNSFNPSQENNNVGEMKQNVFGEQTKEDINQILNPSVFSEPNNLPPSNIEYDEKVPTESVNVDINQIKMNSQNIKKEQQLVDVNSFIQSDNPNTQKKFFGDVNVSVEPSIKEEKIEILDKINESINEYRLKGKNIFKEEKDLGNKYQITITIDK